MPECLTKTTTSKEKEEKGMKINIERKGEERNEDYIRIVKMTKKQK